MSLYLTILGAAIVVNMVHVAVTGQPFMITLP